MFQQQEGGQINKFERLSPCRVGRHSKTFQVIGLSSTAVSWDMGFDFEIVGFVWAVWNFPNDGDDNGEEKSRPNRTGEVISDHGSLKYNDGAIDLLVAFGGGRKKMWRVTGRCRSTAMTDESIRHDTYVTTAPGKNVEPSSLSLPRSTNGNKLNVDVVAPLCSFDCEKRATRTKNVWRNRCANGKRKKKKKTKTDDPSFLSEFIFLSLSFR